MYPMPEEIREEALKHFKNLNSSYHGCHLDTSGSFHSVRNLPKQKKNIRQQPESVSMQASQARASAFMSVHFTCQLFFQPHGCIWC